MCTNCNYSNRGNHLYNKAVYYNVAFHNMRCICGDTNNQNQAHTINELSGRCTDCDAQILAPQFPPFFHEV